MSYAPFLIGASARIIRRCVMGLVAKQAKFSVMLAKLVLKAEELGYLVTMGDGYRDPRVPYGHKNSLHRSRLAHDLNIFKDGKYLRTGEEYPDLGEYWESIGGTWGGRFKDGNHFSLAHGGMK